MDYSLAKITLLQNVSKEDDSVDKKLVRCLVRAHLGAPEAHRVPARFFSLLQTWRDIRQSWTEEMEGKMKSLEAGITTLKEAGQRVSQLEEDAIKQQEELQVSSFFLSFHAHGKHKCRNLKTISIARIVIEAKAHYVNGFC